MRFRRLICTAYDPPCQKSEITRIPDLPRPDASVGIMTSRGKCEDVLARRDSLEIHAWHVAIRRRALLEAPTPFGAPIPEVSEAADVFEEEGDVYDWMRADRNFKLSFRHRP